MSPPPEKTKSQTAKRRMAAPIATALCFPGATNRQDQRHNKMPISVRSNAPPAEEPNTRRQISVGVPHRRNCDKTPPQKCDNSTPLKCGNLPKSGSTSPPPPPPKKIGWGKTPPPRVGQNPPPRALQKGNFGPQKGEKKF